MKMKYLLAILIGSQITCSIAGAADTDKSLIFDQKHVVVLQAGSLDSKSNNHELVIYGKLAKDPNKHIRMAIQADKRKNHSADQKNSLTTCLRLSAVVAAANKLRNNNEPYLPSILVSRSYRSINNRSSVLFKCSVTKILKPKAAQPGPKF